MKFTITIKIFLAFFLLSVISVAAMVFVILHFSRNSFEDYVFQKEMASLAGTSETLAEFYRENSGWERFQQNPGLLHRTLAPGALSDPGREPRDSRPPGLNPPPRDGQPPPDFFGRPGEPPPPPPGAPPLQGVGRDRRPPRPGDPAEMVPRLSLFDRDKNLVAGGRAPISESSLIPIVANGETVGWLGLHRAPRMMHPLDREFMEKQTGVLYLTGLLILLLSAPVAFLLARNLVAPIRQLTAATAALAGRRFETRVRVDTSDELGQLARDFNAMAETLGAYEDRQRQWLADISHELLTPLAVLIGEIEAIQDGVRKPDQKSLDSLRSEAERINRIVADLHLLSLAEAESFPMQKKSARPVLVLVRTLELFSRRLEQAGMKVVAEMAGGEVAEILGDEGRLTQLFSNLLENILRYADKPGTVWARAAAAGGRLTISVEDSGPGVPTNALPRLFDRLYRVDKSRSRATGGSGLGLSICKTIVENHGGRIHATIGHAGGLKIEIDFPLR